MRGKDGVITPTISASIAGTGVEAVVVVACAGIGPAMVGVNRGVRPATSDRNDVLAFDVSDASASVRSGVCDCVSNLGVRPAISDANDVCDLLQRARGIRRRKWRDGNGQRLRGHTFLSPIHQYDVGR